MASQIIRRNSPNSPHSLGWGVGVDGTLDISAKFAAFGGGQGGDTSEHHFRLVKVTEIAAFGRVELVVVNILEVPKT